MSQLNQRFSELSDRAKELDEQALDFSRQMKEFVEELETKLNRRRKKYAIDVRLEEEEAFDFTGCQIDFFIRPKDQYIHYVFTMHISDEFDEDEILKLLDARCKELDEKG